MGERGKGLGEITIHQEFTFARIPGAAASKI